MAVTSWNWLWWLWLLLLPLLVWTSCRYRYREYQCYTPFGCDWLDACSRLKKATAILPDEDTYTPPFLLSKQATTKVTPISANVGAFSSKCIFFFLGRGIRMSQLSIWTFWSRYCNLTMLSVAPASLSFPFITKVKQWVIRQTQRWQAIMGR